MLNQKGGARGQAPAAAAAAAQEGGSVLLKIAKGIGVLLALSVLAGGACFYLAYRPDGVDQALELGQRYARLAWSSSGQMKLLSQALLACTVGAFFFGSLLHWVDFGVRAAAPGDRGWLARLFIRELKVAPDDPAAGEDARKARLARELYQLREDIAQLCRRDPVDIIKLVNEMLHGADVLDASDMHLTPTREAIHLSYRVDGVLEQASIIDSRLHDLLITRLRVMAKLETYEHDVPQDGRIEFGGLDSSLEMRISIMPTSHGKKVVLRVINTAGEARSLRDLGLPEPVLAKLRDLVKRPQGMLFLSGPTGSGKTTTIYAALRYIHEARGEMTNIVTIEDPIEFDLPFLTQTQVNERVGLTFARGLRSLLRQDPNVIMVGEIRDAETSAIAVQAGLTGHTILTTVHTDSAAGVFNRLIEMGVEPFLLASASLGALSQRLVRKLCPRCRKSAPPTPVERERLLREGVEIQGMTFYVPVGCEACRYKGYAGRTAICELLLVTPTVRDLLNSSVPTSRIHDLAVAEGMTPLLEDGVSKAQAGETTLAEVLRVAARVA